jgi:hypothetical protein
MLEKSELGLHRLRIALGVRLRGVDAELSKSQNTELWEFGENSLCRASSLGFWIYGFSIQFSIESGK